MKDLHVCLICIEMFGVGVHGGFGRATRMLGRELCRRGVRVSAIVPRRVQGNAPRYQLDGMEIHEFEPKNLLGIMRLCRAIDADIYHSQDPSLTTFLALRAMRHKKHMVTLRDPLDRTDWQIETALSGKSGKRRLGWRAYRTFVDNPLISMAVRQVDACYCAAEFLAPKGALKYRLSNPPRFLPTPVVMPGPGAKAERPLLCHVGRWEPRKRPELFFELARRCPQADFVAVGGAQDQQRDRQLRASVQGIGNLRLTGFIDQFRSDQLERLLSRSWILVNTSAREGLPNTFIEAAAHGCAILSFSDPDNFASRFGVRALQQTSDPVSGLQTALQQLLEDDDWRRRGAQARAYVGAVFGLDNAMDAHMSAYRQLCAAPERTVSDNPTP